MSKRKGELSNAMIDLKWPHQVALHAGICIEDQFLPLHDLAASLGAAPRGRSVIKLEPHGWQQRYVLFCFSRREDAEAFVDRVGGRHFHPVKDREKPMRRNIWTWREWGQPSALAS